MKPTEDKVHTCCSIHCRAYNSHHVAYFIPFPISDSYWLYLIVWCRRQSIACTISMKDEPTPLSDTESIMHKNLNVKVELTVSSKRRVSWRLSVLSRSVVACYYNTRPWPRLTPRTPPGARSRGSHAWPSVRRGQRRCARATHTRAAEPALPTSLSDFLTHCQE